MIEPLKVSPQQSGCVAYLLPDDYSPLVYEHGSGKIDHLQMVYDGLPIQPVLYSYVMLPEGKSGKASDDLGHLLGVLELALPW